MIDTPEGKAEIRMPLTGKSMAGAAILDNELINIPDCYEDDRFDPAIDRQTGFKTTQMLCVPVTASDGKPIGAIQIINTEDEMSFTQAHVDLLRVFRGYVQIAIINKKRLLENQARTVPLVEGKPQTVSLLQGKAQTLPRVASAV